MMSNSRSECYQVRDGVLWVDDEVVAMDLSYHPDEVRVSDDGWFSIESTTIEDGLRWRLPALKQVLIYQQYPIGVTADGGIFSLRCVRINRYQRPVHSINYANGLLSAMFDNGEIELLILVEGVFMLGSQLVSNQRVAEVGDTKMRRLRSCRSR